MFNNRIKWVITLRITFDFSFVRATLAHGANTLICRLISSFKFEKRSSISEINPTRVDHSHGSMDGLFHLWRV